MKTLRNFFALFVMGALVLASCEKKNEGGPAVDPAPGPGEDESEVVFPDILPTIDAPGAGNITIAIYTPSNTCNGAILVGAGVGEGGTDDWDPAAKNHPFEKLNGEERWYTITIPYTPALGVKVVAVPSEGDAAWGTQWGMITDEAENVVLLDGTAILDNSENDGEVKASGFNDGEVVFIGIKEWKSAPCAERNKAGKALFTAKVDENFPADAILGVVGFINEQQKWDNNDSPLLLEKGEGNVWTLETDVFAVCEYKYRASLDGGATWIWSEGNNIQMALDLKPVDSPVFNFKPAPAE